MKMTDQELRDLVASLAVESAKLQKYQKENFDKLQKYQKENAAARKEITAAQQKNAAAQQKTDEQMKQTDEQMKKTDKKLERMGITLGNIGENNGAVAEEFFYSSLEKNKKLGGITYDEIGREWSKDLKKVRGEYDIVLINGNEVALVEVKYKVHQNDVEKMKQQIDNFKILFPDYKNYKIRGAFASLSMSQEAENEILHQGYFALKQQGNHLEVTSPV